MRGLPSGDGRVVARSTRHLGVLSPISLLTAVVFVATLATFACSNSSSSGDGGATGGSTGTGGATSGTGGGRGGETGAGGSSGGATGTGGQGGAATGGTTGRGGAGGGGHGGSGAAGGGGGQGATGGAGGEGGGNACIPVGQPCSGTDRCCAPAVICAGTCMTGVSDRNMKRDFAPVNDDEVLKAVDALPITSWSYKDDGTKARHIGPMAQDFMSTFHVGSSDKTISPVDGNGIFLAAIKALSQRVKELEARNRSLEDQVSALRAGLPRSHRGGETRRPSGAP